MRWIFKYWNQFLIVFSTQQQQQPTKSNQYSASDVRLLYCYNETIVNAVDNIGGNSYLAFSIMFVGICVLSANSFAPHLTALTPQLSIDCMILHINKYYLDLGVVLILSVIIKKNVFKAIIVSLCISNLFCIWNLCKINSGLWFVSQLCCYCKPTCDSSLMFSTAHEVALNKHVRDCKQMAQSHW